MASSILIIAGEVSGDQHGAALMRAFQTVEPETTFLGLGGDGMEEAGLAPLHHVRDLAVTGFFEVLKHLGFFRRVMTDVLELCHRERPDAAILIDYPGFNLRLGARLKDLGIPVYYYISPQVWAWHRSRVRKMKEFLRRIFVIFPFEESFYREAGVPAEYVGHPILDQRMVIPEREVFLQEHGLDPDRSLVALLPGSRVNELKRHNPVLRGLIDRCRREDLDWQFAVAQVAGLDAALYTDYQDQDGVHLIPGEAQALMALADVAVVSSGTATLETAYLQTPMVVIYRMAALSYLLGKLLVKVDHLAMPNLILGERVVPEFIQNEANPEVIFQKVRLFLENEEETHLVKERLADLRERLGKPGCTGRVARSILADLEGDRVPVA